MRYKDIERITNQGQKVGYTDPGSMAAHIVRYDGHLAREIVEEWLNIVLPSWMQFYSQLDTDPISVIEGHVQGPSSPQALILKRMRDRGHRVGPKRGFFRWIGGHDDLLQRRTMIKMVEKGWLRVGQPAVRGLEYILEPTEEGMKALANYELDTSGRDRKHGRQKG